MAHRKMMTADMTTNWINKSSQRMCVRHRPVSRTSMEIISQ